MDKEELAMEVMEAIWNNLTGRRGIGNELEGYDYEIQEDIREAIKKPILAALNQLDA